MPLTTSLTGENKQFRTQAKRSIRQLMLPANGSKEQVQLFTIGQTMLESLTLSKTPSNGSIMHGMMLVIGRRMLGKTQVTFGELYGTMSKMS